MLGQLDGVQLGEFLAFGHGVVGIDVDLGDRAGELAADDDLVGRREVAGGGNLDGDLALLQGSCDVFGAGGFLGTTIEVVVGPAAEGCDDQRDDDPFADRPGFAALEDGGEVLGRIG